MADLDVHVTRDVAAFTHAAQPFLAADPVRNTILLSVLAQGPAGDDNVFAWVCDGAAIVGAALRTPPFRVALAAMDVDAAAAVGEHLTDVPGAVGAQDVVHAFAAGRTVRVDMREHQYVLTDLVPPATPAGRPRPYTDADTDRYLAWMQAFVDEAGVIPDDDPLGSLQRRLASGGSLWFWEHEGRPVCMAGHTAAIAGVPRIGPVFTPPEERSKGYAAALTAHICATALAAGADACTLFADAANATSNRVYQRIGFTLVGEIIDATFGAAVS